MSLKEESEDESLSESETEDVELEEIEEIDAGIQDPKLLKDHITRIRQVHQNAVKQLHTEKSKVITQMYFFLFNTMRILPAHHYIR